MHGSERDEDSEGDLVRGLEFGFGFRFGLGFGLELGLDSEGDRKGLDAYGQCLEIVQVGGRRRLGKGRSRGRVRGRIRVRVRVGIRVRVRVGIRVRVRVGVSGRCGYRGPVCAAGCRFSSWRGRGRSWLELGLELG